MLYVTRAGAAPASACVTSLFVSLLVGLSKPERNKGRKKTIEERKIKKEIVFLQGNGHCRVRVYARLGHAKRTIHGLY